MFENLILDEIDIQALSDSDKTYLESFVSLERLSMN